MAECAVGVNTQCLCVALYCLFYLTNLVKRHAATEKRLEMSPIILKCLFVALNGLVEIILFPGLEPTAIVIIGLFA